MNGLLVVNKPKNYTSRDVVNIIGSYFKTKKVGHTGTLDPLATGVLVICLNKATKIAELIVANDKEYIAEFTFGFLTDTLDNTGTILKEEKVNISKRQLLDVLNSMIGKYNQEVPIYSAIKVNGKKLYEYARNNELVELPKHQVEIKELELLNFEKKDSKVIVNIRCLVSKGTYIRSLARDIASKLNTIAIMSNLKRIKQGKFELQNSFTIEEILNGKYKLIPISEALPYSKIDVEEKFKERIINGSIVDNNYIDNPILFMYQNKPIALYKIYDKDKTKLKPWKML